MSKPEDVTPEERERLDNLLEKARDLHQNDECEIDGPLSPEDVSEADEHDWVRAWVYVPHDSLEE